MSELLWHLLPLALGIAASPVPVLAAILVLLSPRAAPSGIAFMVSWLAGILAAVLLFTELSRLSLLGDSAIIDPIIGSVELLIAVALLVLAVVQWRRRSRTSAGGMPRWLGVLDNISPIRVAAVGLLLAVANPKNLLLAIAAGRAVGQSTLDLSALIAPVAIYVIVAGSIVSLLVLMKLVAGRHADRLLVALRAWLVRNSAIVASVVLVFLALVMASTAISTF